MQRKLSVLLVGLYLPMIMGLTKQEAEVLKKQIHDTCVSKTGVSEDLITAVNDEIFFPDDDNLKCYTKCIMQEGGVMDDDGIVDVEAMIEILPTEMQADFEQVIKSCGTQLGSTPCENAWLTQKCYSQAPGYHLI